MLITLNAFDITLTLPGIAGIILGIGMAVDANVITVSYTHLDVYKRQAYCSGSSEREILLDCYKRII